MQGLHPHLGGQRNLCHRAFSTRSFSDTGVLHPRRHHVSSCRASFSQQPENADSGSAADSSDCIDTEWRQRRWGSLWNSLAEQDRSWAVLNYTVDGDDYNATSTVDESWDLGSGSGSSAMSVAQALWPATYSPSPGQQPWPKDKRMVFVILFGVGSTETEGIYSLRVISREEGLPQDTIIAFSAKEDAERYAGLLEATMEHVPTVIAIEPRELLDFCSDSGYSYRVEADGSLLIPPDYYVGITDWERSLRLREGIWSVQPRDSAAEHLSGPHAASGEELPQRMVGNNANLYPLSDSSYLVEEQRARLERLASRE